ncbi:Fe-S cluster assembly protein SufD [Ilumatobacter sp.]|uniref:Fe-S cluster assembly protein SufD n=1 Tax=Ilumatobacter sp. TaxID=1967498 RepID=UPI003B515775
MSAFSPDAAREFRGGWEEFRTSAAERFAAAHLPTPDEEIWRYSRIDRFDLDEWSPARCSTTMSGPADLDRLIVDDVEPDVVDGDPPDVFAELNRAFMTPTVVRVPAGTVVETPIVVTHEIAGSGTAVFPRLVIDAAEDSEVTVVERFVAADGAEADRALVVPVLQVRAARAARVRYLAINEVGDATWQIGNQQSIGERDSSTMLATVTLGGDYVRARTEARLTGRGGSTRQVALYFAGGDQMHDFRTIQDHDAPDTHSDLLFKGAVQDSAASVYTGLIKIRKHAGGTSAQQTNRNLTLSEGAWAESVPNLDIETNDVTCSHASTVGPIDEEQRFYLESRGVRPEVAERLVVLGFFDEVIAQLPVGEVTDALRRRVADKLDLGSRATGVAA